MCLATGTGLDFYLNVPLWELGEIAADLYEIAKEQKNKGK